MDLIYALWSGWEEPISCSPSRYHSYRDRSGYTPLCLHKVQLEVSARSALDTRAHFYNTIFIQQLHPLLLAEKGKDRVASELRSTQESAAKNNSEGGYFLFSSVCITTKTATAIDNE